MEHPKVISAMAERLNNHWSEYKRMFIKGRNMEEDLVELCQQKYPNRHSIEVKGLLVNLHDKSVRDLDLSKL